MATSQMEPIMQTRLLWGLIALFALFAAAKPLLTGTALFALVPLTSIAVPVIFVLLHAPRQIGWTRLGFSLPWRLRFPGALRACPSPRAFPLAITTTPMNLAPNLGRCPC